MTLLEKLTQERDKLQTDAEFAMAYGRTEEADGLMVAARYANEIISYLAESQYVPIFSDRRARVRE